MVQVGKANIGGNEIGLVPELASPARDEFRVRNESDDLNGIGERGREPASAELVVAKHVYTHLALHLQGIESRNVFDFFELAISYASRVVGGSRLE